MYRIYLHIYIYLNIAERICLYHKAFDSQYLPNQKNSRFCFLNPPSKISGSLAVQFHKRD